MSNTNYIDDRLRLSKPPKGKKFVYCRRCGTERLVDTNIKDFLCENCVQIRQIEKYGLPEITYANKSKTNRPRGWHFMKDFVDVNGDVYEKGKLIKKGSKRVPTIKTKSWIKTQKDKAKKKKKRKRLDSDMKIGQKIYELKKEIKRLKNKKAIKKRENEIKRLQKKLSK